VLSSRTRRSGSRAAALLRLAAVTVGRTDTALGAFYRRLSARIGKAKAVTATARKIAVLFYNAVRHGMDYVDLAHPSTRPDRARVMDNLHRRAGFRLCAPAHRADTRHRRFLGKRGGWRTDRPDIARRRVQWTKYQGRIEPERLVFSAFPPRLAEGGRQVRRRHMPEANEMVVGSWPWSRRPSAA